MLRNKLNDIFTKVQQNVSCHQKCRLMLHKLYKEVSFEEFEIEFMRCTEILLAHDISQKNPYIARAFDFIGSFTAAVVNEHESPKEAEENNSETCGPPFFETILYNILKYHNLSSVSARFRTCQLIHILLSNLGDNVLIDSDVWDSLIDPLLERSKDSSFKVRVQAIRALARLQTPSDPNCEVVAAFLERLTDVNAQVRKEAVNLIAPTKLTVNKIAERVRDTDHNVRLIAFHKCSVMGPKVLPINVRQSTLNTGFHETNVVVKSFFTKDLLQSWLNAYGGDYMKFMEALKLDSSEEDLKQSEIVCKNVLKIFFKCNQLMTIVDHLSLDENRVIPINRLNYQSALYWCTLVQHLHDLEDSEDYLSYVIPELLPFCEYIRSVVQENQNLEGWRYLEYQHYLSQLFQVAGQFDITDEVGRKALHKLVIYLLTKMKFNEQVIKELISILALLNPNLDSLTTEICHLISEIREPLVEQQLSEDELRERNFKCAELRVKINIATEDCTEAAANGDFDEAKILREKLIEYKKQYEELNAQFNAEKNLVRQTQNNPDVTIRCLDILIGMLSYEKLKTLTISLRTCKDEFVTPLLEDDDLEISVRAYRCLMLFCTLDKVLTQQNLKLITSPVLFNRLTPHENTRILILSITAISDLLRLYGSDVLKLNEDSNTTNVNLTKNENATRRLYTVEHIEDAECIDFNLITSKDIGDAYLEMLDDEREEVRSQTTSALGELVIAQIFLTPLIISKIILKWFIWSAEDGDNKSQQLFGNALMQVARANGSGEIFERTVIPVLTSIGNAPRASPLADIDVDNALRFLAAITSIHENSTGLVNIHKNLAYALCYKILNKPNCKCVPLYIKMLLNLDLVLDNNVVIKELITQTELILEEIDEKTCRANLQKFLSKLKLLLSVEVNDENRTENSAVSVDERSENCVEEGLDVDAVVVRKSVLPMTNVTTNQNDNANGSKEIPVVNVESKKHSNLTKDTQKKNSKRRESESKVEGANIESTSKKPQRAKKKNTSEPSSKAQEDERDKSKNEISDSESSDHFIASIRTSGRLRNKNIALQNREQDKKNSEGNKSQNQTVKRRKQRGRTIDLPVNSFSDETIMHTIVNSDDIVMDKLEDDEMTILTPTTTDSQSSTRSSVVSNSVTVTETSSDSDVSRKSRRSCRTKKRKIYIP